MLDGLSSLIPFRGIDGITIASALLTGRPFLRERVSCPWFPEQMKVEIPFMEVAMKISMFTKRLNNRSLSIRRMVIRACFLAVVGLILPLLLCTTFWPETGFGQEFGWSALGDNFALWTSSSSFLTSLAAASSSPAAAFVTPTFGFSQLGLNMSGPTEDFQTTGMQSLRTFSPPFSVTTQVTATQGTANPFEIFLASSDLTQFLTVTANVSPAYDGMWATAPNISQLWQLGEQFQPPITPAFNTLYSIIITVNDQGAATVTVKNAEGMVLGTLSDLQPGMGPFYLVLGQRIGLAAAGSQAASWKSVFYRRW
jgi:hypothetical protein